MFVDAITSLQPSEPALRMAERFGIARIGYDGEEMGKFFPAKVIEAVKAEDVKKGIEKWRMKALILAVRGNYEANRTAMHDSRVDLVLDPFVGRNDLGVDHICLKKAEENDVAIGITFMNFLLLHRKARVKYLRGLRRLLFLAEKYGVKVVISSGAESWLDMRRPREMMSLLINLGYPFELAMKSVSEWPARMAEMNREKIEGRRKGGVWLGQA